MENTGLSVRPRSASIQLKVPRPRVILFDDPFQIGFGGVLANGTPQVRLEEVINHPIGNGQKRGKRGSI